MPSVLLTLVPYRLTQVVPEKGPLNGCVCVCAHIACRMGSMKRCGVRTSVCVFFSSMGPQQQTPCCKFAVGPVAGDIDWLLQQQHASAGSATLSAYVASLTRTCFVCCCGNFINSRLFCTCARLYRSQSVSRQSILLICGSSSALLQATEH